MELTHKYVYLYNERIGIYVDTPWIQQMMYASMKMAGFYTLTVRSTDKQGFKIGALQLFTESTSQAQILVANINIMATGVNLHDACRVGVIISQHFNPKTNLQIHGRLNRLGQKPAVVWHCLKVNNSFHDHQERAMLTKWARQLSAESNIKKWLTGALREMMLFETMKTYANLVDSNVFMLGRRFSHTTYLFNDKPSKLSGLTTTSQGISKHLAICCAFQLRALVHRHHLPGLLHSYMTIMSTQQTALSGSRLEKKNTQLSALARDEETAMMNLRADISMEKLRDMRDQLGHETLATVSIAN